MKLTDFISKYFYIVIPLFIFIIIFQSLNYGLIDFEDDILLDKAFSRIATKDRLVEEVNNGYLNTNHYRPISNTFFWAIAQIGSKSPFYYRLSNAILLSILSILLVYFFESIGYKRKISVLGALILSMHPIFIFSVGWIMSSSYILSFILSILSFLVLKFYLKSNSFFILLIHFFLMLISLLTNEIAFGFLLFLIFFFNFIDNTSKLQKIKISILWLLAVIIYFIFLFNANLGNESFKFGAENLILRIQFIPELFANFMNLFNPLLIFRFDNFTSLMGLTVFLVLLFVGLYFKKIKNDKSVISLGIAILTAIPYLLITPVGSKGFYDYLILSGMGTFIGIIVYLMQYAENLDFNKRINSIGLIVVLIIFTFVSYNKLSNFKNPKTFYLSLKPSDNNNVIINKKLYEISYKDGELDNAENYLKVVIKNSPRDLESRFKLSELYLNQNRIYDAIEILNEIVTKFDNFTAVYQLVNFYLELGKTDEANQLAKSQIRNDEEKVKILNIYDLWAKNYFKKKDNVTMMKIMKGVLVFDPDNLEVTNYILNTYIQLYEEHKEEFLKEKIKYYFDEKNRILNKRKAQK